MTKNDEHHHCKVCNIMDIYLDILECHLNNSIEHDKWNNNDEDRNYIREYEGGLFTIREIKRVLRRNYESNM